MSTKHLSKPLKQPSKPLTPLSKPLVEVRTTVGPTGKKRIIYKDATGRECYFAPNSRVLKLLYVEDELLGTGKELDPEKLVTELSSINAELVEINNVAKTYSKGFPGGTLETVKLRVSVLKNRSELLIKLLNKSMPDKRSLEHSGSVGLNNSIDSIPDEILIAAVAGKLSDRQMEQMDLLMADSIGGEH